jgi:hypothetical protein
VDLVSKSGQVKQVSCLGDNSNLSLQYPEILTPVGVKKLNYLIQAG